MQPARRPRRVVEVVAHRGLPFLLSLAWVGLLLRFVVGGFTVDIVPILTLSDIGWAALVSGTVPLNWGRLTAILTWLVLRPRRARLPAKA